MHTLEITILRSGERWSVATEFKAGAVSLPVRSEGTLDLDVRAVETAAPGEAGLMMGRALFRDAVRDGFQQARQEANPLHVLLSVEDPALRILPWHRLHAPLDGGRWAPMALDQRLPLSLHLAATTGRRFPPISRFDLRALVLVSNPRNPGPWRLAPFDAAAAARAVVGGLGDVPADVLGDVPGAVGPATLDELCRRVTAGAYTVLHIVAHGGYRASDDEPAVFLLDAAGGVDKVEATRLIERLARTQGPHGLPHFVFLCSCDLARPDAEGRLGGLAQRLVRELGVPAVLAMTAPVSTDSAAALAADFYLRLRGHGRPDLALVEAFAGIGERPDVRVPVPALFTRLEGRPLFGAAPDGRLTDAEVAHGLGRLAALLPERAPALVAEFDAHAAVLRGAAGAGPARPGVGRRREHANSLAAVEAMCQEVTDLDFRALADDHAPPAYDGRCPFRGLSAFGPSDREFFFGREAWVERLRRRLAGDNFLAVLGASGSGKSSVVMAGLVPALRGSNTGLHVAHLTPGSDPGAALDEALRQASDRPSVVVVDQFEEVFTNCGDAGGRRSFFDRVLGAAESHRVVITMRSDFWGDCAPHAGLRERMLACQELVPPLSAEELRLAMTRQAEAVGLRFEPGLAAAILEDVEGEPGAMPLLQHALLELWNRRHGRHLKAVEYQAIGGVRGAIAKTAETFYEGLNDVGLRELARNVFLRLARVESEARPGEPRRDTRRRVRLEALVPSGGDLAATRRLVAQLAGRRLVMMTSVPSPTEEDPDREVTQVEVAHEALIRHWPRLVAWLDENRVHLQARQELGEAAFAWRDSGRDKSFLVHRGTLLRNAAGLRSRPEISLNDEEGEYLDACLRLARTDRLLKSASAVVVAASVLAGLGIWAYQERERADERDRAARDASRTLAGMARDRAAGYGDRGQPGRALLWLARAVRHAEEAGDRELARSLRTDLAGWRSAVLGLTNVTPYPHGDVPSTIAASPDGRTVHVGHYGGVARLWDLRDGLQIGDDMKHPAAVEFAAFSPDGKTLLTRTMEDYRSIAYAQAVGIDTAFLWDAGTGRLISRLRHSEPITRSVYHPRLPVVVTAGMDGNVRVWSSASGEETGGPLPHGDLVNELAFDPTGAFLASGAPDGIRLWRTSDWTLAAGPFPAADRPDRSVNALAFTPDGRVLASAALTDVVRLWDVEAGAAPQIRAHAPVGELRMPRNASDVSPQVAELAFDATGRILLVHDAGARTVRRWEVAGGRELRAAGVGVDRLSLASDRETVLAGVAVSDASTGLPLGTLWNAVPGRGVYSVDGVMPVATFSGDGGSVLAVADAAIRTFEARPAREPDVRRPDGTLHFVKQARLTGDGRAAAVRYFEDRVPVDRRGDAVRAWNTADGKPLGPAVGFPQPEYPTDVHLSTDGRLLLVRCLSHPRCDVWNLRTAGRTPVGVAVAGTETTMARFAPGGTRFLTVTGGDPASARLWGIDGRPAGPLFRAGTFPSAVAFHPSTAPLAVLISSDEGTRCWNPETGRRSPLGPPEGSEFDLAEGLSVEEFSPDGGIIVTRSGSDVDPASEPHIRFWDAKTGAAVGRPVAASVPVAWAFSAEGPLVAGVDKEDPSALQVFRPREGGGEALHKIAVQPPVVAIALAPPGDRLAVASADGIRHFDVSTGSERDVPSSEGGSGKIEALSFGPGGDVLAAVYAGGETDLWRISSGKRIRLPSADTAGWGRGGVDFGPDGTAVTFRRGANAPAALWDMSSGRPIGNPLRIAALSQDPSGRARPLVDVLDATAATGAMIGLSRTWQVRAWNPRTGEPEGDACPAGPEAMALAVSPDGETALVVEWDGRAGLYSLARNEPTRVRLPRWGYTAGQVSAEFGPDGRRILTVGNGAPAALWSAETGSAIAEGGDDECFVGVFSPDGGAVAFGSQGGFVRVVSASDGRVLDEFSLPRPAMAVRLAPHGRYAVAQAQDGTAWVRDVVERRMVGAPLELIPAAEAVAGAAQLLTAHSGDAARLWDLSTSRPVGAPIPLGAGMLDAVFLPKGGSAVLTTSDGAVVTYELPTAIGDSADVLEVRAAVLAGEVIGDGGVLNVLGPKAWREYRSRLEAE